jgi:hypothetical protein
LKVNREIPNTIVQPAVQNRFLQARMSTQRKEDRTVNLCWFAGQVLFVGGMLGTDQAAMWNLIQLYMRSSSTH